MTGFIYHEPQKMGMKGGKPFYSKGTIELKNITFEEWPYFIRIMKAIHEIREKKVLNFDMEDISKHLVNSIHEMLRFYERPVYEEKEEKH